MREAKHRGAQAAKSLTINDRGPPMPMPRGPDSPGLTQNPTVIMLNPEQVLAAAAPSTVAAAAAGPITRGFCAARRCRGSATSALQSNLRLFAAPGEASPLAGCP